MKERQRWRPEEDTLLRAYVKQYGPREWNLVSQRMNAPFSRDAKSCLERWKNYLKPGIKKGSLSEEEQQLVISLQAKHGNKWKKIAAEIPGRTAKRLGKWWEVFKEKQQREEMKECNVHQVEDGKYDRILENFAEKLVKERMPAPTLIPPLAAWPLASNLSNPSLALTLSSSSLPTESVSLLNGHQPNGGNLIDSPIISSVLESFKEMDEDHRAWMTYKKETAWRLRRVELQLESEMANRRREKIEEIESKIKALEEKQKIELERLDTEYKEQLQCLRQDADTKEMKLMEKWAAQQLKLCSLLQKFAPEATMS